MTASVLRPFSAQRRFAGSASLCWPLGREDSKRPVKGRREDRAVHAALPNSRGRGRRLGPGPLTKHPKRQCAPASEGTADIESSWGDCLRLTAALRLQAMLH